MAALHQHSPFMLAMDTKTKSINSSFSPDATVGSGSPWRWAVPLISALALMVLLVLGDNVPVFYFMNRIMSHADDALWIHLSLLGDGLTVTMFVLPFLGRRPDVVWQYVLATLIGGIFVQGMKEAFSALRPPASLIEGSFHLIGPALQNNSFPSGHTTAIFILAGLVCLHRINVWGKSGAWIKFSVLLVAIFVGLSRIANGVHWPVDVLSAAGGGWLIAIAAVWLSDYFQVGMNVWAQRLFAVIFTPLSLWAVWILWHDLESVYPGTNLMKFSLLLICLVLSVPGQLRLFNFRR